MANLQDMQALAAALEQLKIQAQQQADEINQLRATGATTTAAPVTVDSFRLGKPAGFKGDEAHFDDWDLKFRAWLGAQDRPIADELNFVKTKETEQAWDELTDEQKQRAARVHYALIMLCEDSALRLVRSAGENGYEGYRLLCRRYDPQSKSRALSRLNAILSYSFGSKPEELLDKILCWEKMIGDYEKDSKEVLSNSLRSAVLVGNLPQAIRTHVLMNPNATQDYAALKALIESYIISGRRWDDTKQTGPTPMEIDVLKGKGQGKWKGDKGNGKKGNKGKRGKKGKGKNDQAADKPDQSDDKADKEAKTPGKFQGYCGHCDKWGHTQKDCWSKQAGVNSLEAEDEQEEDGWLFSVIGDAETRPG